MGHLMSPNDDEALVIIPFKAKGFAFLLDFAFQELRNATLLDASRLQSARPATRKRKQFQNFVSKNKNFDQISLGSLKSLLLAMIFLPRDYHKFCNNFRINDKKSKIDLTNVLHCRLAAFMGDRHFNVAETPFGEFSRHYLICKRVSVDFENFMSKRGKKFNSIVVFNGREPLEAAFIQIARKYGMEIRIIERGSTNSRYQVFPKSPHYHPDWWNLITNYATENRCIDSNDRRNAKNYYIQFRLKGTDLYFGEAWNKGTPTDFPCDEFIDEDTVIFFTSSSTEFSPFSDFNYDVGYLDQYTAVKELAMEVTKLGLKLAIRRHPNSVGLDGTDREHQKWMSAISSLETSRVKYFGPNQKFNTVLSIRHARAVFVWKSSIGFESLSLGKPTFALATAKWSWESSLRCWNRDEIRMSLTRNFDASVALKVVDSFADFMASSGSDCVLIDSAHKWGIITRDGETFTNGIFEKSVQYLRMRMPKYFGLRH